MPDQNLIPCTVLIPAAGESRRMKDWKPLLPWHSGRLIDAALSPASASCREIILMTGYRGEELEKYLRETYPEAGTPGGRLRIVRSSLYPQGMAATIGDGLCLATHPWVMISLADMPFLTPDIYRQLFAARQEGHTVFPVHRGKRGHPVLLGPSIIRRLTRTAKPLSGTRLRPYLKDFPIREVPTPNPAVLQDIDTPEAYRAGRG